MAPKKSLLEQMRDNPKGDWGIADVQKVCERAGVELEPPSNGSHYKAVSPLLAGHQTVPHKRPIKPFYIKSLVDMIDAHILAMNMLSERQKSKTQKKAGKKPPTKKESN